MPRPSKYTPEVVDTIKKALANGETRQMACKLAGISDDTFGNWLKDKSEFSAIVKDAENQYCEWERNGILKDAVKSLKTLICGIEYEETKTEYEQDPRDPSQPRVKRQTVTTKKVLPNATAVIFALVNRDPEHWQNRINNEVTGRIATDNRSAVDLAKIPDDLLEQVIKAINSEQ